MKLKNRLILAYSASALAAVTCAGLAIILAIGRLSVSYIERQLTDQSGLAEIYISQMHKLQDEDPERLGPSTAADLIGKLGLILGNVRIYDQNLNLQAASRTGKAGISDEENLKVLRAAQKGDYAYVSDNRTIFFASPVMSDRKVLCILEIIYPLSFFLSLISGVSYILLSGAAILVLSMTLVSAYIAGRLTKPVIRLVEAADRFAVRDFKPVDVTGSDEIARLGQSFNAMGSQLQEYIRMQKQFVSNVTHELRTPLTAIIGYSEVIMDEAGERPDLKKAVFHLNNESKRLARLVDEVLALSRIESGHEMYNFQRINLSSLVKEVAERLEVKAGKYGIGLDERIEPDIYVMGDREKLAQVLVNLLDNAFKFSRNGSTVRILLERAGESALISVIDQGMGIPAEEAAKVFERFYRARNAQGVPGTGLGLAIVKSVVEAHKGSVELKERPEGGTIAVVKLPAE